jgi:hypothetical protein
MEVGVTDGVVGGVGVIVEKTANASVGAIARSLGGWGDWLRR